MALVSSVEEKGKAFLFRTWYFTSCQNGGNTRPYLHGPGSSSCPWFSLSLRGRSVRGKNGNGADQYLGENGVTVRGCIFPWRVLNCGGPGTGQRRCGEAGLLEMSGILDFSCRSWQAAWTPGAPREFLSWLAVNKGEEFMLLAVGLMYPQGRRRLVTV